MNTDINTQVTLNSTDTNYGSDTLAWSIRYGTKEAVTFDILTVRRDQVAKNDLVIRYNLICVVTGVTTGASGWRAAAPKTRIYVSGSDWDSGENSDMVTVYRKAADVAPTVDTTAARQDAHTAYTLNPTDTNLRAYQAAADAEMDTVFAGFDARHAADTYTTGENRENIKIPAAAYGS